MNTYHYLSCVLLCTVTIMGMTGCQPIAPPLEEENEKPIIENMTPPDFGACFFKFKKAHYKEHITVWTPSEYAFITGKLAIWPCSQSRKEHLSYIELADDYLVFNWEPCSVIQLPQTLAKETWDDLPDEPQGSWPLESLYVIYPVEEEWYVEPQKFESYAQDIMGMNIHYWDAGELLSNDDTAWNDSVWNAQNTILRHMIENGYHHQYAVQLRPYDCNRNGND